MHPGKKRIIYIYKEFSHFVKKDYETLGGRYRVRKVRSPYGKSPFSFFIAGIRQFLSLLCHIWRSDALLCWFADYHSLLPALFSRLSGKPLYMVLGGYDVTYVEELNYGSFNRRFRGGCARYAMRTARLNLPVTGTLADEARIRAGHINIEVLPTGYDPGLYLPSLTKEEIVLTVSVTFNWERIMVKGIDRFVELAGLLPGMQFVIIGMEQEAEQLLEERPKNLKVLPPVPHNELLDWYGKAKYYAQFSRSEGLPNAVCEAMLRNCIPLGVRTGGIPDAMGDTGILLDRWDPDAMVKKLEELQDQELLAGRAREYIVRHFHPDRREKRLFELMG